MTWCSCGSPAVLWLSVARDKGVPLCGPCADATKAHIEAKCRELSHPLTPTSEARP